MQAAISGITSCNANFDAEWGTSPDGTPRLLRGVLHYRNGDALHCSSVSKTYKLAGTYAFGGDRPGDTAAQRLPLRYRCCDAGGGLGLALGLLVLGAYGSVAASVVLLFIAEFTGDGSDGTIRFTLRSLAAVAMAATVVLSVTCAGPRRAAEGWGRGSLLTQAPPWGPLLDAISVLRRARLRNMALDIRWRRPVSPAWYFSQAAVWPAVLVGWPSGALAAVLLGVGPSLSSGALPRCLLATVVLSGVLTAATDGKRHVCHSRPCSRAAGRVAVSCTTASQGAALHAEAASLGAARAGRCSSRGSSKAESSSCSGGTQGKGGGGCEGGPDRRH